jgi:hypothetical protein
MPQRLFIFMQMEFPWALGPADGRYLLRAAPDGEAQHVLVFGTLAAGRADQRLGTGSSRPPMIERLTSRASSRQVTPDPAVVTTTRVTVIDPVSLSAEAQAQAWLADLDRDREVPATTMVINRILHWHRLSSADPHIHEVSPAQALIIRAGWGEGEQVASGQWLHARELPWHAGSAGGAQTGRRGGRTWALRPQERLAALLGAREQTLLCEEFTLRARLDLDQGRLSHAAIELDRALAIAGPEMRAEGRQDLAIRIAELEKLHAGVSAQAQAALPESGAQPEQEIVTHALERLEAALRARTASGFSLK